MITTRGLQVHHIIPMREDFEKRNDIENLITLCPYHHNLAENGEISIDELQKIVSTPLQFF